jgi:hypothetical protein
MSKRDYRGSHAGGSGKWISDNASYAPHVDAHNYQRHIDLALAQEVLRLMIRRRKAGAANGDRGQMMRAVNWEWGFKDICRNLSKDPGARMSEKQRRMCEKILGAAVVERIKRANLVSSVPAVLQNLPKKPPAKPKTDDE